MPQKKDINQPQTSPKITSVLISRKVSVKADLEPQNQHMSYSSRKSSPRK